MRAARVAQTRTASSRRSPPRRVSRGRPARAVRGSQPRPRASAAPSDVGFAQMAEPDGARAVSPGPPAAKLSAKERFVVHTLSGYKIEGMSVGGQETCIVLPQLKLAFDSGRCPQRCVYADTMCLSHTHMDHVGGVGFYIATRSLLSLPPPTVLLPASRAVAFAAFVDAARALDGSDMPHEAVGMEPADAPEAPTEEGAGAVSSTREHRVSKRHAIRAFATTHPVPSQGYVVYGTKEKLKPEFIGRSASELKALKARGVEIVDVVSVPEVAFTGDTTIDWVDRARGFAPSVMDGARSEGNVLRDVDAVAADALRARLLICECTFVDDRCSAEDARRFGHTHVDDIVARADAFRDVGAILLIHFSARYKAEEVREALARRLPEALKVKVTPMLEGFG